MSVRFNTEDKQIALFYTIKYLCKKEFFLSKKISIVRFVSRRIQSTRINTRKARRIIRLLVRELGFGDREMCFPLSHRYEHARHSTKFTKRITRLLIERRIQAGKSKELPCGTTSHRLVKEGDYILGRIDYYIESIVNQLGKRERKFKRNFKFSDAALAILSVIVHERTHVLQMENLDSYNRKLGYYERSDENEARLMFAEYLFIFILTGDSSEAMRIWDMRHMFTCRTYWGYKVGGNKDYLRKDVDRWIPIYWKVYCKKQGVPCTITNIEKFTREYKDSTALTHLLYRANTDAMYLRKKKKK